jgi:hypothetical protein
MSLYGFNQHPNRESWLGDVADRLRPAFAQLDAPLPERLRIAIGFPSTGRRAKATGECWDSTASIDGTFEILVRPDLVEMEGALALPVAAALVRELIHAAVGLQAGKGPRYRRVALGIGLLGPMHATTPRPAFLALIAPILEDAGPLPHARLHTEPSSRADGEDADEPPRSARGRASKPTGMSAVPAPSAATSSAPPANGSTRSVRPSVRFTAPCCLTQRAYPGWTPKSNKPTASLFIQAHTLPTRNGRSAAAVVDDLADQQVDAGLLTFRRNAAATTQDRQAVQRRPNDFRPQVGMRFKRLEPAHEFAEGRLQW